MTPQETTSSDLLDLFNSLAWPAIITKNKDPEAEKNFRQDNLVNGRWLDGYWIGIPGQVEPNKGFGIHFVERDRLVWIGEYSGQIEIKNEDRIRLKMKDSGPRYSLILNKVQCYTVTDLDRSGDAQSKLTEILKQPAAVTYSYFRPPESSSPELRCFGMAEVMVRLQQRAFRKAVFDRYGARCVITGCEVNALLEAAHLPGKKWHEGANGAGDGIPLRVDLHRALDAQLISLDSEHRLVHMHADLEAEYGHLMHR